MKATIKKSILFILAGSLLAGSQAVSGQVWQYGIQAGLSGAVQSKTGELYNNEDIRTGFTAGVFVCYQVQGRTGLQTGLDYSQLGFTGRQPEGPSAFTLDGQYDYLELPLLVRYSLPVKGNTRFFGVAGLYGGMLVSSNIKSHYLQETVRIPDCYYEDPETFSAGYQAGAGFTFPAGTHKLSLSVMYKGGLTQVFDYDPDTRNKQLTVTAGLVF